MLEEQILPQEGENDSEVPVIEAKPPGPPAGLSFAAVKRVMGEQPIEGDQLEQVSGICWIMNAPFIKKQAGPGPDENSFMVAML